MSPLRRRLAKAPNYVRRFGAVRGLQLLSLIERSVPAAPGPVRPYAVPGFEHPVFLRQCVGDHATFWQCLVAAQYDLGSFRQTARLKDAYRAMLRAGKRPLIIDCGANIGLATLALAQQFPEATVCAVEPDPANFCVLRQNVAQLGNRVRTLHGGVWNTGGHLRIKNPEAGPAAFQVERCGSHDAGAIRAYSIQEICATESADAPFIVKIDIEGAQRHLFATNTAWVDGAHLIALELDDWLLPWQGTSRPFFACLSQYPFDYLIRGETIFCFRDFQSDDDGDQSSCSRSSSIAAA